MAPVAAGVILGKPSPTLWSAGDFTVVKNCEISATLTVSSTVASGSIQLIPGVVGTWLATIAVGFSKWRWRKLRIFYVPVCSTATSGSFHMALQYDSFDTAPTTVAAISACKGYTTAPVWSGYQAASAVCSPSNAIPPGSVCVELDVTRLSKPWYPFITSANLTTVGETLTSAQNQYSPARLVYVSADGPTTAVSAGRLYAQYVIDLIEPITPSLNA